MGIMWNLTVVLVRIFLTANDAKLMLKYLLFSPTYIFYFSIFYWGMFFLLSFKEFLKYSHYECFIRHVISKYLLSGCSLSSHSHSFPEEEVLNLDEIEFVYICCYELWCWSYIADFLLF